MRRPALLFAFLLLASCSKKDDATDPVVDAGATWDASLVEARPYTLYVPDSYDAAKPTPFVFLLHGYGASGALQETLFQLTATAKAHGFLYAYADGTPDSTGRRFWNATDACCDLENIPVDDVAYLDAVIDDVSHRYNVDAKRVYLVGHSNGGFMAHRYACDRASRVAAIASLAGAMWSDASKCAPSEPVAVLQAHGDVDDTIGYDGGANRDRQGNEHTYPSAHQTIADWAAKDGCGGSLVAAGTLDVDTSIPGAETKVERYEGCRPGGAAELWTIHGASHVPNLGPSWGESIWGFFEAHPKP